MLQIAVIAFGALFLVFALLIARRQRGDTKPYGGTAALSFHVFAIAGFGTLLIATVLLSLPTDAVALVIVLLGVSDVLVGLAGRRRSRRIK